MKWTFLEGKHAAVLGASAFRKDQHVQSLPQHLDGSVHTFNGGLAIAAIHRNEVGNLHAGPKNRNAEQLLLHQHGAPARNDGDENRSIEIGDVIRHEDVILSGLQMLSAANLDLYARQP